MAILVCSNISFVISNNQLHYSYCKLLFKKLKSSLDEMLKPPFAKASEVAQQVQHDIRVLIKERHPPLPDTSQLVRIRLIGDVRVAIIQGHVPSVSAIELRS